MAQALIMGRREKQILNKKYVIGVDFGSLSGRALLVEVATGIEVATSVLNYSHAVMETSLPDSSVKLEPDWALQHPQDWMDVFATTIPDVLKQTGITAADVIGIGVDFTACTSLPTDKSGKPLCFNPQYAHRPHAWPKLWKHHAAQDEANFINETALSRNEKFVNRYGGKQSSEGEVAKILQIVNEDPEIYDVMDKWIEATDWVTWQLTGQESHQVCTAGYKGIWHKKDGYPSKDFFKSLHPKLENYVEEKLSLELMPLGSKAGEITASASKLTGLAVGTAVCVGNVDAHVSLPALGIVEPGKWLMIIGTSSCDIMLGDQEKIVPGMCGVVEDGSIPEYYCYEAGQSCVGDHFDWFVKTCVPSEYIAAAVDAGVSIHSYLREKARQLRVGETGLLSLDWWNGNRSVLVDVDLTGMMLGMTLATKPEDIYRTLIESTAFGKRIIIEAFRENGVPVHELYACGGIASKDDFMMQIYADVMNMELRISGSEQAPALGASMFAAVAAGKSRGGYDSIVDAATVMGKLKDLVYKPIPENVVAYHALYTEFKQLHDYFGRGENDVMKRLKLIRTATKTM